MVYFAGGTREGTFNVDCALVGGARDRAVEKRWPLLSQTSKHVYSIITKVCKKHQCC